MTAPTKFLGMAALSMLLGFAGCASAPKSPTYVGYPDLQSVGLRQLWEQRLDLAQGEEIANAWRIGESMYVTTNRAAIIRLDATSGVKVWEATLVETTSEIHRPVETQDGKNVLVVNRGTGYLLEKRSGAQVVRSSLNMSVMTDPVVSGNVVALGGMNAYRGMYIDTLGGQKWIQTADNDVFVATPAQVSDNLITCTRGGKLWRITIGDGTWDWKDRKTNGEVVAGIGADTRAIYVPCLDSRVYCFDAQTGSQYWDTRLEGTLDQTAIPLPGQVLVPSTGKGLYSLTTDKGDMKWLADGVTQVGTVVGGTLWAGDAGGNLRAIALDDGRTLSTTRIPLAQLFVRNSTDDTVFMVNKAGVVAAYSPIK